MKPAALVTTVFLLLVACAHVVRIVLGIGVIVRDIAVPMWMSGAAALFTAGLAAWLWQEQRTGSGHA